MARILYGVHGSGHGHAMRALTIARRYPGHQFLFLGSGAGLDLLRREYPVFDCPNLDTPIRSHRVAMAALLRHNLPVWLQRKRWTESVRRLIESYRPDAVLTDYEFFTPLACRSLGIPCLSVDHQHVITSSFHSVPVRQLSSYFATCCSIDFLFSNASEYLVVSFFRPAVRNGRPVRLVAPLLRESVLAKESSDAGHVVAYQGHPTNERFFSFLKATGRRVMVYGVDREGSEGNLHFRKYSEEGFLDDVASSRYVMCGGGHTLISEALFLGKPVVSFPIANAFEQYLNAFYLERMGWGANASAACRPRDFIASFESRLDVYRENIAREKFVGNDDLYSLLDHYFQHGRLPDAALE